MTQNEIAYWKLQEEIRSNRAGEQETHRANTTREAETHRSNVAQESHNVNVLDHTKHKDSATIAESKRHNLATEDEAKRHNKVTEKVSIANAVTKGISDVGKGFKYGMDGASSVLKFVNPLKQLSFI